ncbi:MAG: 4-phosphoerythronate dehydrogenase [Tatlockia sp.]|jgi:erythronate-4-phosphate dehydrogenase
MKLLADASLPALEIAFPKPFEITLYKSTEEIAEKLQGQDVLFCRSTLKVNEALLKNHSLRYVATASSGVDHIDSAYLQQNAITLLDAKGCNATSVTDYVTAVLAYLQKNSAFSGKTAAVLGVGEVGSRVVSRLKALKMNVLCYDPFKTEISSNTLDEITQCQLIAVHANLHDEKPYPSRNLIDKDFLSQLKPHTVLINASRGGIVNEEALLHLTTPITYCTDVYQNEPYINQELVKFAKLCTPHIAGHSIEAKYNAVALISEQLHTAIKSKAPKMPYPAVSNQVASVRFRNWQDFVLSLYNPVFETNELKASTNLETTFLKVRKAHLRHDFCRHETNSLFD